MNRQDKQMGDRDSSARSRSGGSAELVIKGWSSMLAIIVTSLLLVQCLTGIWVIC